MTQYAHQRLSMIQSLWQQYQGLYVVAGILIGLLLFPFLELLLVDFHQLLIDLTPEAIGIGFTVLFLDRIYERRETERLKKRLVRESSGQSNEIAKSAIDWMRYEGWLSGDNGLLVGAELQIANLVGADLSDANLQGANLRVANLSDAICYRTNLRNANLKDARLTNAILYRANLQGANLENVDLSRADLLKANLEDAKLINVNLDGAILPDGASWNPDTDMKRFTDREHPDFWHFVED